MKSKRLARPSTAPTRRNVLPVISVLAITLHIAVASALPASALVTTPTTGGTSAPAAPPAPAPTPTTTTTNAFVNRSFGPPNPPTTRPHAPVTTPTTAPPTTAASSPATNRAATPASVGTGHKWQSSGPEFVFSTADIGRLSALGLVGVISGWFVIAAGRRRRDDEESLVPASAPPGPASLESPAPAIAPLYLDRRQRRERRKLWNRLFHRDPSVDRRTEKRRQRRR